MRDMNLESFLHVRWKPVFDGRRTLNNPFCTVPKMCPHYAFLPFLPCLAYRRISNLHVFNRAQKNDLPLRHQQNKELKLKWPLEIGEAKIVWWLF